MFHMNAFWEDLIWSCPVRVRLDTTGNWDQSALDALLALRCAHLEDGPLHRSMTQHAYFVFSKLTFHAYFSVTEAFLRVFHPSCNRLISISTSVLSYLCCSTLHCNYRPHLFRQHVVIASKASSWSQGLHSGQNLFSHYLLRLFQLGTFWVPVRISETSTFWTNPILILPRVARTFFWIPYSNEFARTARKIFQK